METKDIFNILAIIDDPDNTLKFDKNKKDVFINCVGIECNECKSEKYCCILCKMQMVAEVVAYLQENHLSPELFL